MEVLIILGQQILTITERMLEHKLLVSIPSQALVPM